MRKKHETQHRRKDGSKIKTLFRLHKLTTEIFEFVWEKNTYGDEEKQKYKEEGRKQERGQEQKRERRKRVKTKIGYAKTAVEKKQIRKHEIQKRERETLRQRKRKNGEKGKKEGENSTKG